MPRKAEFNDNTHQRKRQNAKRWYDNSTGKLWHKMNYLRKKYDIGKEELEGLDGIEEKLEYCNIIHIRNKYGITVKDFDDTTTVCTEPPLVENI